VAFAMIAGVSVWMFDSGVKAVKEAPQMALKISEKARELKMMLPPGIADRIPDEDEEIQSVIADGISKQMPSIAGAGKAWVTGALFALIGWIIGLLMANIKPADPTSGPLARQLREHGKRFSDLFKQIVVAQFFVSCANTFFAAIYLFGILPLAGIHMPWAGALVVMTLVISMIPVAGNILCNGVVTLVALSVGPGVALASLAYLIVVHKLEYFINAKVLGKRVSASVWELLLAMFTLEAIFGVGGLVAAPLFYAYIKSELKSLGWV
jgi:predicted PurR-regulated permease PerM